MARRSDILTTENEFSGAAQSARKDRGKRQKEDRFRSFDRTLEALPSKEPGVHRPRAWAKKRQSKTQHPNNHAIPGIRGVLKRCPHRVARDQGRCHRCPKPNYEEEP